MINKFKTTPPSKRKSFNFLGAPRNKATGREEASGRTEAFDQLTQASSRPALRLLMQQEQPDYYARAGLYSHSKRCSRRV